MADLSKALGDLQATEKYAADGLWFPTIIPHEPGAKLGEAYNRAMKTVADWVLFIDHDLYIVNPNWYRIMLCAIREIGHRAGWITCYTNRVSSAMKGWMWRPDAPKGDDIEEHRKFGRKLWDDNGLHSTDITQAPPLSGFWILTHKKAWEKVGGFKPGQISVDNDYHIKLVQAGYEVHRMDGMYVYHHYGRDWLWK